MNEKLENLFETGVGCWLLIIVTVMALTPCALVGVLLKAIGN